MANAMLAETREIEQNLISKLNCTYLAARQVSMPTLEYMLNKEAEEADPTQFFKGFSVKINELINAYFGANYGKFEFKLTFLDDVEIAVAGSEQDRNQMMPLLYVDRDDCEEEKTAIRDVLDAAHSGETDQALEKIGNRMKPIDVVKVLMGIHSQKEHIKRFMYKSPLWAKLQEHDFAGLQKLAESEVQAYYIEALGCANKRLRR